MIRPKHVGYILCAVESLAVLRWVNYSGDLLSSFVMDCAVNEASEQQIVPITKK
jgi:hypothetical protein